MAVIGIQAGTQSDGRVVGAGVFLRRPRLSDYPEWAELRRVSRAFLTPWEPSWAPDELTRPGFRRRLRRYDYEERFGVSAPFLVFRTSDGALVGGCNVNNIRRGVCQSASIGYWAGLPHRRRGYMRAAVKALSVHAFGDLGLHRLEAACIPSNTPSRSLLLSLGFREEGVARSYLKINGVWRDHVLHALLADELDPGWGGVVRDA